MSTSSSQAIFNSSTHRWLSLMTACCVFGVLLWIPTPHEMTIEAQRLAAVTAFMAVFWLMQPVSIAVTSLLPLAAYPLMGILSASQVSQEYANHNVFLFLGGFAIAVAIEQCGLHRRIALHIISRVGSHPRQIVMGFMLASALLSMWISNTATTMMMLPIALALLSTLSDAVCISNPESDGSEVERLTIPVLLGIAYASSIGGLSTFVGTPTNVSFLGYWDRTFVPAGYKNLSMAEWMATFVPLSLMMLATTALIMTWGLKPLSNADRLSRLFFRDRLKSLGPASGTEMRVFCVFLTTALLWVLRKPLQFEEIQILPDWPSFVIRLGQLVQTDLEYLRSMVQDSTIAIAMAALLFLIPGEKDAHGERAPVMSWAIAEKRLPWGMILLIGSGFAMASGFQETGLSAWLGNQFAILFADQSTFLLILGVCLMVTFLTEFTTNVATVNTLLPTLAAMSVEMEIDPRLLLVPATVSASCAFMLPIATPPNAIIFGSGRVPMKAMIRYGIMLNLIGSLLVTGVTLVLASRIMKF